jgi:hypothetical protein
MPIPDSARRVLARRLDQRRQERWPELLDLNIRYHGSFAYINGVTATDDQLPLCRLRYLSAQHKWGFAIYLASKNGYEDSILPHGAFTGTPEEALDCACGLYLNDITAWTDTRNQTRTDSRENF